MGSSFLQPVQRREQILHSASHRVVVREALCQLGELEAEVRRAVRRRLAGQEIDDLELERGHLRPRLVGWQAR